MSTTDEQLAEWERTLEVVLNSHLGLHALCRMHTQAESDGSTEESNREGRAALAALVAEVRRLREENVRLQRRAEAHTIKSACLHPRQVRLPCATPGCPEYVGDVHDDAATGRWVRKIGSGGWRWEWSGTTAT